MRTRFGVAILCAMAFALPAAAHHSHGSYSETFSDISGVVKEVHLVVPHSWVYLEVKNPKTNEAEVWALEGGGRAALVRAGITPQYMKPGDNIKVRCHALRDGSNGCLLGFIKAADGSVKDWDSGQAPPPKDF